MAGDKELVYISEEVCAVIIISKLSILQKYYLFCIFTPSVLYNCCF